jgi:hypothetical protein
MEERIGKTTNVNNQLRRETDRAKEVYMEEIWSFRRKSDIISCIIRHNNKEEKLEKSHERLELKTTKAT